MSKWCELTHGNVKCIRRATGVQRIGGCPECGYAAASYAVCKELTGQAVCNVNGCTVRLKLLSRLLTGYEAARAEFLENPFAAVIEGRDALAATVTLEDPPGWDTYGSIMKDWDKPAKRPARRRFDNTLFWVVTITVTLGVWISIALGVTWLVTR